MKKTFKLKVENKHPDRVVEAIKHEVRKYIKREKRKPLPEDKDFWFFDCKFAKQDEEIKEIQFSEITKSIDEAVKAQCETFYLEVLSRAEKRAVKEIIEDEESIEEEDKEQEVSTQEEV